MSLWAGKIQGVAAAVGAALGTGVADADPGDFGAEDAAAVDGTVHPPGEGAAGGTGREQE